MSPREKFIEFLKLQIGKPYLWNSNGPGTYDCSGLICAAMRAAGLQIGDHCVMDLHSMFMDKSVSKYTRPGQLFFYHSPASHVMAAVEYWGDYRGTLIGARGGWKLTSDLQRAWDAVAFVDCVRSNYWENVLSAIVDPWED
jgi:hypothetical protein